jgi:hypothetical protein
MLNGRNAAKMLAFGSAQAHWLLFESLTTAYITPTLFRSASPPPSRKFQLHQVAHASRTLVPAKVASIHHDITSRPSSPQAPHSAQLVPPQHSRGGLKLLSMPFSHPLADPIIGPHLAPNSSCVSAAAQSEACRQPRQPFDNGAPMDGAVQSGIGRPARKGTSSQSAGSMVLS